jgi:hypothetical protein
MIPSIEWTMAALLADHYCFKSFINCQLNHREEFESVQPMGRDDGSLEDWRELYLEEGRVFLTGSLTERD